MTSTPKKIINPISKKQIKIGGPTHLKLIEDGILDQYGFVKGIKYKYSTMGQMLNAVINSYLNSELASRYTDKVQQTLKNTLNEHTVTLTSLRNGYLLIDDLMDMGIKLGQAAMILHYAQKQKK